jgi:uncharacterized protein (UPF0303 family)
MTIAMPDDAMPSVAELAAEEDELQLTSLTNDDVWDLGCALVAAGRRDDAPVAVDINRNGHRLFPIASRRRQGPRPKVGRRAVTTRRE